MANNYLQPVNNHFDIDKFADVDDDLFLRNTRTSAENKAQRSTNPFEDDDEISTSSSIAAQRQAYAEKRREIEQRTLDSTQKSLGMFHTKNIHFYIGGVPIIEFRNQVYSMKRRMWAEQQLWS